MPRLPSRRSRTLESDSEEDDSRPETPASTAPNDRKRIRQTPEAGEDFVSDVGSESAQSSAAISNKENETKPDLIHGEISTSGHQPGAIVRVKLTNFVTYSSAEFKPGPGLNMIIGPNGTGKSTLVCAICLGLGWGTQYLGRAKDAAEFVKHGCAEASIEIELQRSLKGKHATRRNPVIRRVIKRDGNKSKFFLNGNESAGKTVQQLARQFSIQIENLCQFLPQDKVVEFAQMSPIEILESTQRAAAPPEMVRLHENLKQLRVQQKELLHANRGDREHLDSLERRQEMSRTEVERMKERAIAKKKLGWLEKLRPVPLYGAARKASTEARERQKLLQAELAQLKHESAPALRKVHAKEAYKKQAETLKKQTQRDLAMCDRRFDEIQQTVDTLKNEMADCENRAAAEKRSNTKRRTELHQVKQRIAQLEHAYTQKPPDFDSRAMNQEIQELRAEGRQCEAGKEDISTRMSELRGQGKTRQEDCRRLERNLAGLDTQSGQQEGRLEAISRDTFRAWKWIQDNQNVFEQQVYGPPVVECSLKDPKMADAVEAFLQKGDFCVLTVQNQRDFALLQRKLNTELGLHDIRLRTCSDTSLDAFHSPLSPDEMQELGFNGYAIDHLVGPPTVLAMLCYEKRLHSCAIAARDLSQELHDRASRTNLSAYFSKGKRYQFIHRKEYGDAGSVAQVRDVAPAANWTKQGVDMGRKAAIERQIAELKADLATIKAEFENCKAEVKDADDKMNSVNESIKTIADEKETKQKALTDWSAIPTKIKQEKEKESQHEEFLAGARERMQGCLAERNQYMLRQVEAIVQFAAASSEMREAQSKLVQAEIMLIEATSDFEVLAERNKIIKEGIETKTREEKEATETAKEATERARKLVKTFTELRAESLRLEEEGDRGFTELLELIGAEKWTTEKLDGEIDSQKAQIELTEGGNANAIKEYEERATQIEKLTARLMDFNERQAEFQGAITEVRERWEADLDALVAKISAAFGDSFARIRCAGQVVVHKASSDDPADCSEENGGRENGLDFANWAIHISVKFREEEPLSLLDSHRQSGGERAVSTIFYLMALQSLSRAPFRVVDEINQGMDPRNERMVHGRMVDIATDEGGSQYFLITPKLLSGLKYRRGMTVLCIVSGENVPGEMGVDEDGNEFENPTIDFKEFVRIGKELGHSAVQGGRRVDSGVGLERSLGSAFSREGSRTASVGA